MNVRLRRSIEEILMFHPMSANELCYHIKHKSKRGATSHVVAAILKSPEFIRVGETDVTYTTHSGMPMPIWRLDDECL